MDNAEPIIQLTDALTHAKAVEQQGMSLSRELMYQLLQMSIEDKNLDAARFAHAIMARNPDTHACVLDDRLIQLFAICGAMFEANLVFCLVEKPSCHTWHAILSAHTGLGFNKEALYLFGQMQRIGIMPSKVTILCILKASGIISALCETFLTHALIIDSKFDSDIVVGNALLDTYAKCGSLMDACCIFEKLKTKDVVSWNALMAGYALSEQYFLALECFCKMQEMGVGANHITFSCILNVCGALEALLQGRLIHAHLLKSGMPLDVIIRNTLIDMYVRCRTVEDAYKVFSDFPDRDVVSWSAIIAGCTQQGYDRLALELFAKMQQEELRPDRIAYVNAIKACSSLGVSRHGVSLHAEIMHCSFESDVVIGSVLVDMYANCACLDEALKVFNGLKSRNLVSWNAIIGSVVQHAQFMVALQFFERMQQDGVQHDQVTSWWVLKACGNAGALEEGHWIHEHALKAGFESDLLVESSLFDMYVKLNDLEGAKCVLNRSSDPSNSAWNAMIQGCASHKQDSGDSSVLENISQNSDEVALSCILKACATLKEGMLIHEHIIRSGIKTDVVLGTSIISMYAKLGDVMAAQKVFDNSTVRNIVTWNVLIGGYAQHGFDIDAIGLFGKLQQKNDAVLPNSVTCLSALKACANVGAIIQGRLIHDLVIRNQSDDMVMGGAIVDMYAKCGGLKCAQKVLYGMPKRSVISWGALLCGYGLYGLLDLCQQCLEAMRREGVKPDERVFTGILVACSHSGLVKEGRWHFKAMQEVYGLSPSMEHYICMINLLCRAGCLCEAKEFLCAMPAVPDIMGWTLLFTASRLHGNRELATLAFDRMADLEPQMGGAYPAMLDMFAEFQMSSEWQSVRDMWRITGAVKKPAKAWIEVDSKLHEFNVVKWFDDVQPANVPLFAKLKSLKLQMRCHGYSTQIFEISTRTSQDVFTYKKRDVDIQSLLDIHGEANLAMLL